MEDNFPHSRYMRNDTFFKMRRNKIMMKICQNFSKFVIYKITTSRQLLKKTIEPKKPNTEENLRNRNKGNQQRELMGFITDKTCC